MSDHEEGNEVHTDEERSQAEAGYSGGSQD